MDKKIVELLEDEQSKHDGRYYDAGVWLGLNWVLEEAEKEAERRGISVLEAASLKKERVFEDFKAAKQAANSRKVERFEKTRDGNLTRYGMEAADGAKGSLLAGELEGLETAIELLKETV